MAHDQQWERGLLRTAQSSSEGETAVPAQQRLTQDRAASLPRPWLGRDLLIIIALPWESSFGAKLPTSAHKSHCWVGGYTPCCKQSDLCYNLVRFP